jgi:hypothetical protein
MPALPSLHLLRLPRCEIALPHCYSYFIGLILLIAILLHDFCLLLSFAA